MKSAVAALLCLSMLVVGHGATIGAAESSPVERVVKLLGTLKDDLVMDEKVEQKIYDKYACWCEKTSKRKADAIVQAQEDLKRLSHLILKLKGKIATLTSEIEELTKQIEANEKMQAELTEVRQKENAAYTSSTEELKDALAALEKATIVLREATAPETMSFLQVGSSSVASLRMTAIQMVLQKLPSTTGVDPKGVALLSEFTKGKVDYAPQSGTIQGILTDMYDTFAKDLESSTLDEANANREYEKVYATLEEQNNEMKAIRAEKEEAKAKAEEELAAAQQSYDDTEKQMQADIEFFDETKAACAAKHEEWVTRSSLRMEEIQGVDKALAILTTDSARELFASAITPGKETGADTKYETGTAPVSLDFLQLTSDTTAAAAAASKAFTVLRAQAKTSRNMQLAELALRIRNAKVGHFDAVLKAIDELLQVLSDEGHSDMAKRDQCLVEYKEINGTIADLTWKIKNNNAAIAQYEKQIDEANVELENTKQEILETNWHKGNITETRTEENTAFLAAKKQDQEAIKLLQGASAVLRMYYGKNNITMGPLQGEVKGLVLRQGPVFNISEDQAPDATFSDAGHRKGQSKDALSLLAYIIQDLQDEIRNGMKDEEAAQLAYMKEMAAADKLLEELGIKKVNLQETIARLTQEKAAEEVDLWQNEKDLKAQVAYKAEITPDCDWIIGAFTKRAERRKVEADALTTAREYLAGANFPGA